VRDTTPSRFVLGIVQDIPIKALDQPVPGVTDFVRLPLRKALGMLLVTKPQALINEDDVYPFRQDEVVPSVWANLAEVICEKFLLASRAPKSPGCNEPLFTLEVFYKVFNRVERAQQYVKRRVIQNVNETPFWVNLTDAEGTSRRRECKATVHQDDTILTEEKMIITYEIGVNHQAATSAESTPTCFGNSMGNNNTMNLHPVWLRKWDWKRLDARTIEKETVGVLFNPTFGTINLIGGLLDRLFVPSPPGNFRVNVRLVLDIFVTKEEDVVLEHYEQVADFFSVPTMTAMLVAIDARIAPKAEEGTLGELRKVSFRCISAATLPNEIRTWWEDENMLTVLI